MLKLLFQKRTGRLFRTFCAQSTAQKIPICSKKAFGALLRLLLGLPKNKKSRLRSPTAYPKNTRSTFWCRFGLLLGSRDVSGRLWALFGFNLAVLGAAWSPWAPILISEIDFLLIFDRFWPPNLTKIAKTPQESKFRSKFETKSSTHNVSISISRLASLPGCGGLREAVSI